MLQNMFLKYVLKLSLCHDSMVCDSYSMRKSISSSSLSYYGDLQKMHFSWSNTSNQRQEEGCSAVYHTCVHGRGATLSWKTVQTLSSVTIIASMSVHKRIIVTNAASLQQRDLCYFNNFLK